MPKTMYIDKYSILDCKERFAVLKTIHINVEIFKFLEVLEVESYKAWIRQNLPICTAGYGNTPG